MSRIRAIWSATESTSPSTLRCAEVRRAGGGRAKDRRAEDEGPGMDGGVRKRCTNIHVGALISPATAPKT